METGHDGRELDTRSSSKIEKIVPVAKGKATRFFTQSEEGAWQVCTPANCNDNVPAVSIKLKVDVWRRDRILSQRQSSVILQGHTEQQLWCRRLRKCPTAAQRQ